MHIILMILTILGQCKLSTKPHQNHFENIFYYDDEYYNNHLYVSKVYWNANFNKRLKDVDPRYLYYKDGDIKRYTKYDKIGQGAFSQVFLGLRDDGEIVVMKELKPMKWQAINREIQVLKAIKGTTNTLQLIDAIRNQNKKQNATFIYQYLSSVNLLHLFGKLELPKIKLYMYQLLKALNQVHSKGVMHRDVKMANIIIKDDDTLYLIDWGLGEFYHPKKRYNTRVGTRYYKAPELLVNNKQYDYSVDMWAFGCTLASMIFQKQPLFKGKDVYDQLDKIVTVLGTEDLLKYLEKYDLIYPDPPIHSQKPFTIYIDPENAHLVTKEGLDLISKLLVYDHKLRLTAEEAMAHSFFDGFRI
ncbi:unnamed protein product [Paramecium primaurelia]|uniref:non-specific serine/threonine protein kinase n=1 Tax=Paramecium primaurelia TaxID=5886 RepID=A0A8S1KB84_PARPR|nr:unnamed protein product [Paramecium primaurelia]